MKTRELINLKIPKGAALKLAHDLSRQAKAKGLSKSEIREKIRALASNPSDFLADPHFSALAECLVKPKENLVELYGKKPKDTPYKIWGEDLDQRATIQLKNACELPISRYAALMPDAHSGYGLPIGGVLATSNAVIPYAVGVDIACRMHLSILDLPSSELDKNKQRFIDAIEKETRFGIGASFERPREHEIMDRNWSFSPVLKHLKDKAHIQLGTSGSGNHFVEFGELTLNENLLGLKAGSYLALLSHSGSRGTGAKVAEHFCNLAMRKHRMLPKKHLHLAWLDLNSEEGEHYWRCMQWMGDYAAANHELIHHHIIRFLRTKKLASIENHHNFAWKEKHHGEDFIIHRKGATPAQKDVLGIIPGSMATPAFIVRGKGNLDSLCSASHGAGRLMSRKEAKNQFNWNQLKPFLEKQKVHLISATIDESPFAYKDIHRVMNAQNDLVEKLARFDPRIVKMAGNAL